ncbi:tyrosine-type recombinase/integrase [Streptomyces sp. 21So2-11]|uniref:tyrosine-type recombinase/integrase n=1 Tax=Streptomyces sp. 21So2-11 TaxID=3144408 RepID=UPI0032197FC5
MRTPRTLPRVLGPRKVEVVLGALNTARDRAMVLAMLLGGLRRCEVLGLRLGDRSPGERRVFVSEGKGGHQRLVPVFHEWDAEDRPARQLVFDSDFPIAEEPLPRSSTMPRPPSCWPLPDAILIRSRGWPSRSSPPPGCAEARCSDSPSTRSARCTPTATFPCTRS